MAGSGFTEQLKALGYQITELGDGKISFPYEIPTGKFSGQSIRLGFVVPGDFPVTPPSGPHISPRLLPINTRAGPHPAFGVHESSQFGAEWEYWSRPIHHWNHTKRTAKDVMAHARHLFDTQ
jgi:hypothetical protein